MVAFWLKIDIAFLGFLHCYRVLVDIAWLGVRGRWREGNEMKEIIGNY